MSETPKLEPCPFCGGRTIQLFKPTCRPETPYNPADRLYPRVTCMHCHADVPGANEDYRGETAITAWNRRALQPGHSDSVTVPTETSDETPPEILASKLIDAWCAEKGGKISWRKCIEIVAIVTKQPLAEVDRLLALGADDDGRCEMCGQPLAAPSTTPAPETQKDIPHE